MVSESHPGGKGERTWIRVISVPISTVMVLRPVVTMVMLVTSAAKVPSVSRFLLPICRAYCCKFSEASVTLFMPSMISWATRATPAEQPLSGQAVLEALGLVSLFVAVISGMSVVAGSSSGAQLPGRGVAMRTSVWLLSGSTKVVEVGKACGGRNIVNVPRVKLPVGTASTT